MNGTAAQKNTARGPARPRRETADSVREQCEARADVARDQAGRRNGRGRAAGEVLATPKTKATSQRAPRSWGDVYRKWLRKGCDHGDAAFRADQWEKRAAFSATVKHE